MNTINNVINYINNVRNIHSEISDDVLLKDPSDTSTLPYTIFYMNGNDGTDFDFSRNKRTCEFMVFYKKSEMGFIKAYVCDDDTISGYYFEECQSTGKKIEKEKIATGSARAFADQLLAIADNKGLWDMPISRLDFAEIIAEEKSEEKSEGETPEALSNALHEFFESCLRTGHYNCRENAKWFCQENNMMDRYEEVLQILEEIEEEY